MKRLWIADLLHQMTTIVQQQGTGQSCRSYREARRPWPISRQTIFGSTLSMVHAGVVLHR